MSKVCLKIVTGSTQAGEVSQKRGTWLSLNLQENRVLIFFVLLYISSVILDV